MTLMELMVVIFIIGILISLLIPAIRAARESGRLAVCQNNLRQMGLALEMHYRDRKGYPIDGLNEYGIGSFLLPYLEQQPLYERLKPIERRQPANIVQSNLGGSSPSIFRCPSIGGSEKTILGFGRSNYLGTNCLFPWQTAEAQIRDGKSGTIALGETTAEHGWVFPGTASAVAPNNDGLFSSDHELGAFFVFCDGSVHFIDEAIDPDIFTALCTINGGEPIGNWKLPKDSGNGED